MDGGRWNYQRLARQNERAPGTQPGEQDRTVPLPDIVLRNARVEYGQIKGGVYGSKGTMVIEGRLSPSANRSHYSFELQSRGAIEGVGPIVAGKVQLSDGRVIASMTNFRFGRDIESMLPSEVRDWWLAHELQGGLNIPSFQYTPAANGRRATFHVETKLDGVTLAVRPQEMAGQEAARRMDRKQESLDAMRRSGLDLTGLVDELSAMSMPPSIAVQDVTGVFTFDDDGIRFNDVVGSLDQNLLKISGRIDGYTPDATAHLRIESPRGSIVSIPANLPYVASLPDEARAIYNLLRPHGDCTLWMELDRKERGARPEVSGVLHVIDAACACKYFPYPVHAASGTIEFGREPDSGFQRMEIQNIRGRGIAGGPNENTFVTIGGWVGPFDNTVGCNLRIEAENVNSEPALYASFPQEVRDALELFRDKGSGISGKRPGTEKASLNSESRALNPYEGFPRFHGKFVCDVIMPIGPGTKPNVSTDIMFDDADGTLAAFPYPLRHLSGAVKVRDGSVEVANVAMHRGDASLLVNGRVDWPTSDSRSGGAGAVRPDLVIATKNLPIDDDLLNAFAAEKRAWVKKIGLSGKLDIAGHITAAPAAASASAEVPRQNDLLPSRLGYDLAIDLHDGAAQPLGDAFAATNLSGQFHVTQDQLSVANLHGRRGESVLFAAGTVDWSSAEPKVALKAGARKLALDDSLYKLLPQAARDVWNALSPKGMLDADLTYAGSAIDLGPSTRPVSPGADYALTLRPRDLSVMPKAVPYRLDDVGGGVTVTPHGIVLSDITAKHGGATFDLSGTGAAGDRPSWDLKVQAHDVPVDGDLARCVPPGMKQVMDALHLKGSLALDLSSFKYRSNGDASPPDIDMTGRVGTAAASMQIDVAIDDVAGGMSFDGQIRNGQMHEIQGDLGIDHLTLAERPLRNLKAQIVKDAGVDALHIRQIQGLLAGGEFAGNVNLNFPDDRPSSYSLDIVLKNADVSTVSGLGQDIRGQLSASLALEGDWNDVATRRGRGDAMVTGRQMYQIPLLLGLFEVTNLSLPNTNPFSEGTARYAVEGRRITFDQIQMRSDSMVMSGDGWLDFGTKKVRMNFSTDNPNWPKVPFIHELWQGAKQELMQIQVRGTVKDPKVSAASLHTFTTTVDEVFSGSGREK